MKTILRLKNKVSDELYTLLTTGNILHLHLKRKWYDKIAYGEKLEEYRKINDYWGRRFISPIEEMEWASWDEMLNDLQNPNDRHYGLSELMNYFFCKFRKYDLIIFENGYGDVPTTIVECNGITVKQGEERWGAITNQYYFTILLGNVLYIDPCSFSTRYEILDKNGDKMPDHYSGRKRTYEEASRMLERLNYNGEYKPYKMVKV